ncbi:MAG: hypothetical protein PWQ57_319 [Desulfovibrionales bacterium]|nr:hypothetical protein [Desulfovibrionales bacterium]
MDPISIYDDIKSKIIWLDFPPGTVLNQLDLAKAYGVSRSPVTLALARLHVEQWVVRQGSHFVASPLTLERMREITEIRSVLEMQANVWAMHRITPQGLNALKALGREIKKIEQSCGKKKMFQLDYRFHSLLYREARNQQLAVLLEQLLGHYIRFWLADPGAIDVEEFFHEANEIITAIETRDEISLRAATGMHIKVSLNRIMNI